MPDEDSLYVDSLAVKFLNSAFADGKKLSDLSPWAERDGIEQAFEREVPAKLKDFSLELKSSFLPRRQFLTT